MTRKPDKLEEEFATYWGNTGLGAKEVAPNPSVYSEGNEEDDDSDFLLDKSKPSNKEKDFLVDNNDNDFSSIFDMINSVGKENDIVEDIESLVKEINSNDTPTNLSDNVIESVIETETLEDNHIEPSLNDDSEENSLAENEDIETLVDSIRESIDSFNPDFKDIVGYKVKDISTLVKGYLSSSINKKVEASNYNLEIRELVKSQFNNESMIKLTNVLNLRENLSEFSKEVSQIIHKLEEDFDNLKKECMQERDNIIRRIENFKVSQVNELNNLFDGESKLLQMKEQKFRDEINRIKPIAINSALTEHKELFEDVESLKDEVEEIKENIVGLLGKNFISSSENKIEIPRNKEELEDLIEKVNNQLDSIEIKDSSFYKRTISKLMRVIFAPTRFTEGSIRSVVLLINVIAFLILAVKFRELFLLIFTSTIMIDLYNQIRLSNRNSDTDLVMEFVVRSDEIVQSLTNEVIMEETTKVEKKTEPILINLSDKFKELRVKLTDCFNDKLEEIDLSFEEEEEIEKVEKKYERIISSIDAQFSKMESSLGESVDDTHRRLELLLDGAIDEAKKIPNIDIYEEGNNNSLIYNPTYKVGRLTIYDGKLGMDLTREFKEGSYLIVVNNREEKEEALEKVKLLTIQQLTHLRPEHLKVNFIDLEEMGNDFMDMFSEEEGLTQSLTTDEQLENLLKDSFKEIETRYRKAVRNFDSVTDFNRECRTMKEEPFKYQLNIFYNYKTELFRKQQFRTMLTEGGKAGIINVVIFDKCDLYDTRGEADKELEKSLEYFDFNIEKRNGKWVADYGNSDDITKGSILPSVANFERETLMYNRTGIMSKMRDVEEILEGNRQGAIPFSELQERYSKELFTKDTLTGIEICVGFEDGNLDKPKYVTLGDELVHALMGGKTGAGKSNTINVILMNLLRTYSPEWLELYMVDFKNVEFNFYTETVRTDSYEKKISKIPHTSMIAGTTDAQYALSVFSKALRDMEKRKKILAKGIEHNGEIVTFKKIESYNRFVLKHGLKDKYPIIPRILILLDEFQVMFQIDDSDVISTIKRMITRLSKEARSMGIHMFFTSQSMEGTLSDDVKGQFAMRWCLSATAETSKELIGNDAASKLKGKGGIIMNGSMERKVEDNITFKVPLIPEEYITETLEEIRAEARRLHEQNPLIPFHRQEFYDEKDAHNHKELKAYLSHPVVKKERDSVLMGPKVIFREKSTPENFVLGHDDGDNVLVMGNDKVALADLINTLADNFASKERTKIVIANFDKTLDGLIDMKHHYTALDDFMEPNDALSLIETMLEQFVGDGATPTMTEAQRKVAEMFGPSNAEEEEEEFFIEPYDPNTSTRYYVFLIGINKAEGFNQDYIDDDYMGPLVNLLKYGPASGITTIINYRPPFKMTKILPQVNHRISAKTSEDVSFDLFSGRQASNLIDNDKTSFGIYKSTVDDRTFRFKVYQYDYSEELLKPKELEDIVI